MTQPTSSFETEQQVVYRTLNALLAARRAVLGSGIGIALLLVAIELLLPRTYTASVSIQPLSRRVGGDLTELVAQFGGSRLSSVTEPPEFYAELARSRTILGSIVEQTLNSTRGRVSLIDYYDIDQARPALRRYRAVERLRHDVHVSVNSRTGVVQIDVTLKDPHLAWLTVQRLVSELNSYNLKTRQSQARAEREFAQKQVLQARNDLRDAEDRMRAFLKRNRGPLITPDLRFEEEGLQRDISVRQQVYLTLTQLHEQAKLDEVRDTPVLNVVEPAVEPPEPDKRGILMKAIIGFAAGFGGALIIVIVMTGLEPRVDADPVARFLALRATAKEELVTAWRILTMRNRSEPPSGPTNA